MTSNNRRDYLKSLAEDYDVPLDIVEMLASLLGPNEDFDALVTELQDFDEYGIFAVELKS